MLDAIDRQIITILQQDGRAPNVSIARRIGVSEATVRKRLERLVEDEVIRVTAIPDAAKVGLSTVTFLTLGVDLALLDRITEQLSRLPEVRAIYYTSGESDLIVEVWLPSADELLRFLTQRVAAIRGIRRTATSHVLRTIKDAGGWELPPVAPARILVVDDDPDFVEISRRILAAEGYDVAGVARSDEALASMRVSRPNLVILDVMMQGMLDGVRTARAMRADAALRSVPILMVSSISSTGFADLLPQGGSLPADNLLVKPVDHALLVAEVRRLLRGR